MVNLVSQYNRFKTSIDSRVSSVFEHGKFVQGPEVKEFENELAKFLGVDYVVTCGNGTDALQIAFMAMDFEPGSEVIIPSFAYAALPEVLLLLNLNPVFVDVHEDTFLIDIEQVKKNIGPKTVAIAPVHLFGQNANMEALHRIAEENNLKLIEDAAQSLGSWYCSENIHGASGCIGDIGISSFFPSKNLGCFGDGGAIFTNDIELAEKARKIANHGQSKKYHHELVGLNSRLDTMQAAILLAKLPHLESFIHGRVEVAKRYQSELSKISSIKLPKRDSNGTHSYHQYTIKLENSMVRDNLAAHLNSKNISSMIYYPLPLYRQKAYSVDADLPVSMNLCNTVLSLPICPELTTVEQIEIINEIKSFFNQ